MKNRNFIFGCSLLVGAFLLLIPVQLWAQEAAVGEEGPLQSSMTGFLVEKNAQGEETLIKTDQLKPGQIFQYALAYKNISDKTLTEVSILGPIPAGTMYLGGSASVTLNARPEFSIDAGDKFQPEPVRYRVKQADGSEKEEIASPEMYTHIRWNVGALAAQQQLTLTYRVQVR